MTAVEHGIAFDNCLSSSDLSGHIFYLCHDDILLREGLLELKALEDKNDHAVFGPWRFFSDSGKQHELTVRQFRKDDGTPMSKAAFGFLLDQQIYCMNISGVVIPAEIYKEKKFPWHLCAYGCRSEYLHLSSPQIRYICQLSRPAVKIRQHTGSEGALMSQESNQYDTILYLNLAFSIYPAEETRHFTAYSLGYAIKRNLRKGIYFMFKTQYCLWRSGNLPLRDILKIWHALFSIAARKLINKIIAR